jgi:hypothetical protein
LNHLTVPLFIAGLILALQIRVFVEPMTGRADALPWSCIDVWWI